MSGVTAVMYREGKIRATNSIFVFWDLFYPLAYLLIFGAMMAHMLSGQFPVPGVDYNSFFLAGVLGMAGFGIAANSSWGFFMDRDNGIFFEMLTYPLSRGEYLFGKALFNLGIVAVQAILAVGLAALALGVHIRWERLPLLALVVLGAAAGWFYFYAIFALRIRRNDAYNTVTSIFYFAFLFASSIFYPVDPLPLWFRVAALANPITWHVDLLRYASIGLGDPGRVFLEGVAFVLFGLASFLYAVHCLRTQE